MSASEKGLTKSPDTNTRGSQIKKRKLLPAISANMYRLGYLAIVSGTFLGVYEVNRIASEIPQQVTREMPNPVTEAAYRAAKIVTSQAGEAIIPSETPEEEQASVEDPNPEIQRARIIIESFEDVQKRQNDRRLQIIGEEVTSPPAKTAGGLVGGGVILLSIGAALLPRKKSQ